MEHILTTRIMEMVQSNNILNSEKEHLITCKSCQDLFDEELFFSKQLAQTLQVKVIPDFSKRVFSQLNIKEENSINWNLFFSITSVIILLASSIILFSYIDLKKIVAFEPLNNISPLVIKYKFFIIGVIGCLIVVSAEKFYYYVKEISYN